MRSMRAGDGHVVSLREETSPKEEVEPKSFLKTKVKVFGQTKGKANNTAKVGGQR